MAVWVRGISASYRCAQCPGTWRSSTAILRPPGNRSSCAFENCRERSSPHTRITVVQGTWYFALGDKFDRQSLQELKAGSYAFAPKGRSMFGFSPDGAIVQVHGVGPFQIHWRGGLKTLDDADAKSSFRFSRTQRVVSPRGNGQVMEGYASGTIVQYEIKGANGDRFMANEGDLRLE